MSFIKTQAAEEMETHTSVEEIIRNTFAINEENDSAMKLLSIGGMSKAVSFFTEKDDKKSLQAMIQQQVKKTIEKANALEVDNKVRFRIYNFFHEILFTYLLFCKLKYFY